MSKDNFYSDEVTQSVFTLIDAIRDARKEAIKRGIEANTILINKRLAYVNGFDIPCKSEFFGNHIEHFPPMIMGMEAYIDIPDYDEAKKLFDGTSVKVVKNQSIDPKVVAYLMDKESADKCLKGEANE